jgi:hypothetical protein
MTDSFESVRSALEEDRGTPRDYSLAFVSVLPISGAAVSTLGDLLGSETVSASDSAAARLDEMQFDLEEGPCWDALRTARPVAEPRLRGRGAARRWPAFVRAVQDEEVASIFAFPLAVGHLRFGAVDMYSAQGMSLDRAQTAQAGTLAGIIGKHVLRRALESMSVDDESDAGPHSRRVIHQATGVVLAQLDLAPEDARLVIHGHAFATGRSVMDVAEDIVGKKLRFSRDGGAIEVSS